MSYALIMDNQQDIKPRNKYGSSDALAGKVLYDLTPFQTTINTTPTNAEQTVPTRRYPIRARVDPS